MKAPRFPVTKLLLAKGGASPHRAQRKVERDNIPIHQQQFPTKQPLRASGNLVIEPSLETIDPVPIHRENFPIPLPPPLPDGSSMDWDDEQSEEDFEAESGFDLSSNPVPASSTTSTASAPTASALPTTSTSPAAHPTASPAVLASDVQQIAQTVTPLPISSHDGSTTEELPKAADKAPQGPHWDSRVQARTVISCATLSHPASYSRRIDKKIRGLEEYMGYYLSTGSTPLGGSPPHDEDARPGDLFVHSNEEGSKQQVWMRTADAKWERVNAGRDHPYLLGYRLLLKNGKPAWVTPKTIATYHYRK